MMDLAQAQAQVKFKTKPSSMISGPDRLEYEDFFFQHQRKTSYYCIQI